jgi:hypothetical protein
VNKVYQLLVHGRWFSPGTPASSTTKTGCHDIAEILQKVALNTTKSIKTASNLMHLFQIKYQILEGSWIGLKTVKFVLETGA